MRFKLFQIPAIVITFAMVSVCVPSLCAQTFSVITDFFGINEGPQPGSLPLARDSHGNFYGVSASGGAPACFLNSGCGAIYKVDPTGKVTTIYKFLGPPNDGAWPESLILDSKGNLYGTTQYGGNGPCTAGAPGNGCGTVFKLTPDGKETILHSFAGPPDDGQSPNEPLTFDSKGNLYGATYLGGPGPCYSMGCGTVYKIDPTGKETIIFSFDDGPDGGLPSSRLLLANDAIYGTTGAGGTGPCTNSSIVGCGTVFKLSGSQETVLYSFQGPPDGYGPTSDLVLDHSGNLYGTTSAGGNSPNCTFGPNNCGTVFKLASDGTETILHSFDGLDGFAIEGLVMDSAGNLFGSSEGPAGTIFEIDTSGNFTLLYNFINNSQAGFGPGDLIRDAEDNLYGSTDVVLFRLTP